VAVALLVWPDAPVAAQAPFVVVVNKENPVASLSLVDLQRIFRRQTRMWPHGEVIVPVDWDATSPMREQFSRRVLQRSVREMGEYWVQQSITQGLAPPSTQKSAKAILRYVANVPGAISYVPVAEADETIKTIVVKGLQ
jgi:ABC-type phosphate transport system substrate-binding protein